MKVLALVPALLVMSPCERPPVEYQGDPERVAHVIFSDPATVDAVCREASGMQDSPRQILACTRADTAVMLLPNPCLYEGAYSALVCHEMSHINGWRHDG